MRTCWLKSNGAVSTADDQPPRRRRTRRLLLLRAHVTTHATFNLANLSDPDEFYWIHRRGCTMVRKHDVHRLTIVPFVKER
jgi:hypothetical protein